MKNVIFSAVLCLMAVTPALADEVRVVDAKATLTGGGLYRFDVTLQHADTGWDHYANAWSVIALDGTVLGTRTLFHPHVDEQPFTRSLSGVKIPEGITSVTIVGIDSVHGPSDLTKTIRLPGR